MSEIVEPTAEELRTAAAVIRKMNSHPLYNAETAWSPNALDNHASFLEDKQAEKAKRDKRVEEIVASILRTKKRVGWSWTNADLAKGLLDDLPSLLDETGATS